MKLGMVKVDTTRECRFAVAMQEAAVVLFMSMTQT
jgi:hypothetical protein